MTSTMVTSMMIHSTVVISATDSIRRYRPTEERAIDNR